MTKSISTIGVIGAGTMGAGIATVAATNGFPVVLIDATDEFVKRGMTRIKSDLDKSVARGAMSADQRDVALARVQSGTDYGALSPCDIVIEAVPETLAIKQPVLTAIAEVVSADCIIASNTSSLSISDLATFITEPERMVGMHFFNPVPRMALVEVVAGNNTLDSVTESVISLAIALGKTPVRSADKAGFIVNRVLIPMINEAIEALQDGVASADDIDTAMKLGAGHPMGPLALADLIGLDVVLDIMRVLEDAYGEKYTPAPLLIEHVEAGTLGRKSGRGFFSYEGGK